MTLIAHRGAVRVTRNDLDLIDLPPETDTYKPVGHYQLANTFRTIASDLLTDYVLIGEDYAIARNANQLFACLKFQNQKDLDINHKETGISIAFRNSLDRSMSIGLALGVNCFVCDNMALSGDICVMKKHTLNVWAELENLAITTLYKAQKTHHQIIADSEAMKQIHLTDNGAYQAMGLLFGLDIISPRQLPVMLENWKKPKYDDFRNRNAWSLYNSATEALKSSPPVSIINNHLELHRVMTEGKEIWER